MPVRSSGRVTTHQPTILTDPVRMEAEQGARTMTEQELETVRKALIDQYPVERFTFDDFLAYGVIVVAVVALAYFFAHFVAYLVA